MKKFDAVQKDQSALRKKAEIKLRSQVGNVAEMAGLDVQHPMHELETHRITLEIRNEELRNIQEKLETSRIWYSELYDFAPWDT